MFSQLSRLMVEPSQFIYNAKEAGCNCIEEALIGPLATLGHVTPSANKTAW